MVFSSTFPMKLTYQQILELQSLNHGWNSEVLYLLGVNWPPGSGWLKRLVGTEILPHTYDRAFSIKNSHLKPKTIERLKSTARACESSTH
jgi:hypothetical protein